MKAALSLSDRDLNIAVTWASLGKLIHSDPATLPISSGMLTFQVELCEVHSRMQDLRGIRTDGGNLLLSCGVAREFLDGGNGGEVFDLQLSQ